MIPALTFAIVAVTAAVAQVVPQGTVPGSNPLTDALPTPGGFPETIRAADGIIVTNGTPDRAQNRNSSGSQSFHPQPAAYPYFQVSTIPIPHEPRYFIERTKSDMTEILDRAARDVDFAESQISLSTESARTSVSNDVNESKNFVIKNHESMFNEALQKVIDEEYLWECAKKGEKLVEMKSRIIASRVNDCIKRASNSAMDVVASTKSHIAEDRTRRMQKFNDDIQRLNACIAQQERHCIREQIALIERNVNSLAADAKSEVERVREARRQQISEFAVCKNFQDRSYLHVMRFSDDIVDGCIGGSHFAVVPVSTPQ